MKFPRHNSFRWFGCSLITAGLAWNAAAAGVTVVTHGFLANITDWIIPMVDRIPDHPRFPGVRYSCYEISITENSQGNLVASRRLLAGDLPTATDSGEILIKLDWSELAGFFEASSTEIAGAAATALISSNLFPELGIRPLAELPLHLVGHSRGGSVVSEISRILGSVGLWVDHVTFLDPHPVVEFGDAPVRAYANVLFADSYYQMDSGFACPNGESVAGAYDRFLANLNGGYSCNHSDAHLWYHGTIDATTPTGYDGVAITAAERQTWWTASESLGATAGFHYSRLGKGDRLSTSAPAGPSRIRDGYNQLWDLGAGVAANRTFLPVNAANWPNLIQFNVTGSRQLSPGDSTTLRIAHQFASTTNVAAALQVALDVDFNPYNSNHLIVATHFLPGTGASNVYVTELDLAPGANVPPGTYAVFGRISGFGRERYLYAADLLTLAPPPQPPSFVAGSVQRDQTGHVTFTVAGTVGQTIILQSSPDLQNWSAFATNTLSSPTWTVTDSRAPFGPSRFYRARSAQP